MGAGFEPGSAVCQLEKFNRQPQELTFSAEVSSIPFFKTVGENKLFYEAKLTAFCAFGDAAVVIIVVVIVVVVNFSFIITFEKLKLKMQSQLSFGDL